MIGLLVAKLNNPFREPLPFAIRYLLATNRFARAVAAFFVLVGALLVFLIPLLLFFLLPAIRFSVLDATMAGFAGVLIGAGISALISYSLQLDQFKAQALRSKKERIYRPLYEDLIAFATALSDNPYPWSLVLGGAPTERQRGGVPSFYIWNEISTDARLLEMPKWLTLAFDFFVEELFEYGRRYAECSATLESALVTSLVDRGLLQEANGFSATTLVLRGDFHGPIVSVLSYMNHGSPEVGQRYAAEAPELLPELLNSYSEFNCVKELRALYQTRILVHLRWLTQEIEKVMMFIDIKYESQDRYL